MRRSKGSDSGNASGSGSPINSTRSMRSRHVVEETESETDSSVENDTVAQPASILLQDFNGTEHGTRQSNNQEPGQPGSGSDEDDEDEDEILLPTVDEEVTPVDQNLLLKILKILKTKKAIENPFSAFFQSAFKKIVLEITRANTHANEHCLARQTRSTILLEAAGRIYVLQCGNLCDHVQELALFVSSATTEAPTTSTTAIQRASTNGHSQDRLNLSNATNMSITSTRRDSSMVENEEGHNTTLSSLVAPSTGFENGEVMEHDGNETGTSQNLTNSLDSMDTFGQESNQTDQVSMDNEHTERSGLDTMTTNDTMNGSVNYEPELDLDNDTLQGQGLDSDIPNGNGTLELENNDDLESTATTINPINMNGIIQLQLTSTPLRGERIGVAAGTRLANCNSPLQRTFDIKGCRKVQPADEFGHRRHSTRTIRNLFREDDSPDQNGIPLLGSSGSSPNHIGADQESVVVVGDLDHGRLFDCMYKFLNGTQNRDEIKSALALNRFIVPMSAMIGQHIELEQNQTNADSCTTDWVDWLRNLAPPPSQLFRHMVDPDDNTGPCIKDVAVAVDPDKFVAESSGPLLKKHFMKSAIDDCSISSLKSMASHHAELQTRINRIEKEEKETPFDIAKYEMDLLNAAHALTSGTKELESEHSQESGYGSQQQQLGAGSTSPDFASNECVTFEQMLSVVYQCGKKPTHKDLSRYFNAHISLLSHGCLGISGVRDDSTPEEGNFEEPMPSTSKNIPPPPCPNQNSIDIMALSFKPLKSLPGTEAFRLHEAGLNSRRSTHDDDDDDAQQAPASLASTQDKFVEVEQEEYTGELFSKRSRLIQEKRRKESK